MIEYMSEWIERANCDQMPMWAVMLEQECSRQKITPSDVSARMEANLRAMEQSAMVGEKGVKSRSGLTGMDAPKLKVYAEFNKSIVGEVFVNAIKTAVAVNEVNASMGVICANPTAGSAGVVPGVLFATREKLGLDRNQQRRFLFTAAGIGLIIGNRASLAGATGGCQAEVGSSSAMAAGALVEAAGGSPEACGHAVAIALKNLLGLVCDPVAGLVEIPCIKRNAIGAVNALAAAEMALAGIESNIPVDEVIKTMGIIGSSIPSSLRETAQGGLAMTPTGQKYAAQLSNSNLTEPKFK